MLDWRLIKISLLQKDFGVIQKNMFTQILIFVPLPPPSMPVMFIF